jgi:hypothetical protein
MEAVVVLDSVLEMLDGGERWTKKNYRLKRKRCLVGVLQDIRCTPAQAAQSEPPLMPGEPGPTAASRCTLFLRNEGSEIYSRWFTLHTDGLEIPDGDKLPELLHLRRHNHDIGSMPPECRHDRTRRRECFRPIHRPSKACSYTKNLSPLAAHHPVAGIVKDRE